MLSLFVPKLLTVKIYLSKDCLFSLAHTLDKDLLAKTLQQHNIRLCAENSLHEFEFALNFKFQLKTVTTPHVRIHGPVATRL